MPDEDKTSIGSLVLMMSRAHTQLYKMVLTVKSVDEIPVCDHSNESYWAVLPCGTVYYTEQGGSNFNVYGWNPCVWAFKWKLLSSTFMYMVLFTMLYLLLWHFAYERRWTNLILPKFSGPIYFSFSSAFLSLP